MNETDKDNFDIEHNSIDEIEFLPDWYRQNNQCNCSYRVQYILLAVVFVMILILDSIYVGSLSQAEAQYEQNKSNAESARMCIEEYKKIKGEVNKLQKYSKTLQDIDSRIDVSNVLGELSYIISDGTVLTDLQFSAESFPFLTDEKGVRKSKSTILTGKNKYTGKVRFKISISGIGSDSERVASLVCDIEDSPYFSDVKLLFARNTLLNFYGKNEESRRMSKFQLECYLANYSLIKTE